MTRNAKAWILQGLAGLALALGLAAPAAPAGAQVPLGENAEIVEKLMAARVAEMIVRYCPDISGRLVYAISEARALKKRAIEIGYEEAEVDAWVENRDERRRVFAMAREYMEANGAVDKDSAGYCALGRSEIANQSYIGSFIYEK